MAPTSPREVGRGRGSDRSCHRACVCTRSQKVPAPVAEPGLRLWSVCPFQASEHGRTPGRTPGLPACEGAGGQTGGVLTQVSA